MTSNGTAVSIVVPTLREAANLRPLAGRVAGALADSGVAWELLLVVDASRDGSEAVAAELGKRLPVRMAVRRGVRADLSHAVLDGIALGRYDRIVVMDADLSHPPERIPDLLAGLDAGCDMVVGSRYTAGASTAREWGLARVLNSRVATGIVNLLRVARSCLVKSTPPIVLSRRTSPHPIQRTRECGADGGEPIAGGVDRLGTDSARYREPTRTVGAERPT